jgi:hypothetical protein
MAVRLDLVGIVVKDMGRSLAFYRQLGLDLPPELDGQPHAETTLPSGLRLAWDTQESLEQFIPGDQPPAPGSGRIGIAFLADSAAEATPMGAARRSRRRRSSPAGVEVHVEAQGDGQVRQEEDQNANRNVVGEQSRVIVGSKAEPELEMGEAILHQAHQEEDPAAAEPAEGDDHDEQKHKVVEDAAHDQVDGVEVHRVATSEEGERAEDRLHRRQ